MYGHHTLLSPLNILMLNELLDPEAKIIIITNIKIKKYQKEPLRKAKLNFLRFCIARIHK